jgi:hypothetical protein
LEYLGIPFAIFEPDFGRWKFPLKNQETLPDDARIRTTVLQEYHRVREARRANTRVRRDPLYHLHGERWLESLILGDPKQIDPDLSRSPLYSQVPAYAGRRRVIDLLAVTESGRLAVLEIKVQRTLDLLFQGLSYWQIVWQALCNDDFQRNGYFGDRTLRKEPPLLFCVTPLLLLHPEERPLAKWLSPEVEAYLIGINSNWREGIQVLRKERLN